MSITAFQRIRISCPSLTAAVADYQTLLGLPPTWRGRVTLPGESEPRESAWFFVQNTVLELLQFEGQEPSLAGLVLSCDEIKSSGELNYESEDGSRHYSPEQLLHKTQVSGQWVTLESSEFEQQLRNFETYEESAIDAVDHIVLYTNSAEGCIKAFSEEGLGIRLALDKSVPEWGGRMLFFRQGKMTLEVIEPNDGLEGDDYFWGIAYQVNDLDKVLDRLQQSEVLVSEARDGRKPGTRVASVKSHQLNIPTLLVQPAIKR